MMIEKRMAKRKSSKNWKEFARVLCGGRTGE